jgi:hypothetical protein
MSLPPLIPAAYYTGNQVAEYVAEEVAAQRIDYTVLHAFANAHSISYNDLCAAVRAALTGTA